MYGRLCDRVQPCAVVCVTACDRVRSSVRPCTTVCSKNDWTFAGDIFETFFICATVTEGVRPYATVCERVQPCATVFDHVRACASVFNHAQLPEWPTVNKSDTIF